LNGSPGEPAHGLIGCGGETQWKENIF